MKIDDSTIVNSLKQITQGQADAVVEVRLLPLRKMDRIVAGYFDATNFDKVPGLLMPILQRSKHIAYVTLHQLHPGLIARYNCRFVESPELTTSDNDVLRYRWIIIDVDPIRPRGINSTIEELAAAKVLAERVDCFCQSGVGLGRPLWAMSGNGYHLLYPFDAPVTTENTMLVKNVLATLAKRFDSSMAKVDTTMFNPGRITKLYGCPAGKGDGCIDRPSRVSALLQEVSI